MKTISTHAAAAKAIRTLLKQTYPAVKFSVKSDSYTGGDSVRINYEDGPLYKDVYALTGKFQEGTFNSYEDIYEYDRSRSDIPQVKYVLIHRSMSDAVKADIIKELRDGYAGCEELTIDNYYNTLVKGFDCWGSTLVTWLFVVRDYTLQTV